jgi:putative two-component system hydrogenase maturation factor HypX/HoxX
MDILLLVSSFNGLSQRAWCALRAAGHRVTVELAVDEDTMVSGVELARPDIIICPFLKDRVPAQVWRNWRTIIIHPGPVGDRGPSSLDWAITGGSRQWGVTALQAVEEMDAGPIWATRTFPLPVEPERKSALYNGPVADAAIECVMEVVAKAADPTFRPVPLEFAARAVAGTGVRPTMRQADRSFDWETDAADIVRRVRAADGAPGVRTSLAGLAVNAYDAKWAPTASGVPGAIVGQHEGAVLVAAGDGAGVWLGHLKSADPGYGPGLKLPATRVLGNRLSGVPTVPGAPEIRYVRHGAIGEVSFECYNGAFSTGQCRRLAASVRHALAQDTRVLVLRGGTEAFSNGIHLTAIEAARDPAAEAWANIRAINSVCRAILAGTRQVIVAGFTGNAGAGGVMLPLGADVVAARAGVVLNPYYDIGLYGSELHTYALPGRVGAVTAADLLSRRLPIDADEALRLGLADVVGPRTPAAFAEWLHSVAEEYLEPVRWRAAIASKRARVRRSARPLSYYEAGELSEMAIDMFDDRHGFAGKRTDFVYKRRPTSTPPRLALHRNLVLEDARSVSAA